MKAKLLSVSLTLIVLLTGCSINLGNRSGRLDGPTTLGQELLDLKRARDAGVLSEEEYQKQRQLLIKDPAAQ